jgi:hypothetical protein
MIPLASVVSEKVVCARAEPHTVMAVNAHVNANRPE